MKTMLLLALFALAGCVTVPPMPMEATDAPSTDEMPRLGERSMGSFIEKPWRSDRRGHISDRGPHKSACEAAPGMGRHRGSSQKGQKSKGS